MSKVEVGDTVKWKWGKGVAEGVVTERFTDVVQCVIDGNDVKRNASEDEPAFLIEQSDGQRVLKSVTEVEPE